jgi:TonB family protein
VYVSIKGRDQISIVQVAGFIPGVGSDGSIVTNAKSRFRQEINADIQHARGAIALSLPSGTKMQEVAFWAIFGRDDEAIFEYPDWYWFNSATNSESLKALRAYLLLQADGYRNAAAQVAFMLKVPITKQSRASDKRFKVYRNDKGIPAVYRWVDDRVDANFAGVLAEEFNASTSRRRQLSILYGLIKHRVLEVPDGSPKVPFGCSPPGCSRVRARSFGNIAPYRKHLMKRLAEQWHPKKSQVDNLEVLLELSSKGELLSSEIFQSSGDKTADTDALEACRAVKYEPLPSWYRGDTLTFKIEFARVHPLKGK